MSQPRWLSSLSPHQLARIYGPKNERPPPATKRISTPAGQRLSVILENASSPPPYTPTRTSRLSFPTKGSYVEDSLSESPDDPPGKKGYSYSIWSEVSGEKLGVLRNNRHVARRGGWKRLALVILLILATIIAVVVGVVVGLKKKSASSSSSAPSTDASGGSANSSGGSADPTAIQTGFSGPGSKASGTAAAGPSSTSSPSQFPLGSYSMTTFLDTVQTDCTSNPSTWSCYPYTVYNSDATNAMATFDWVISAGPQKNTYQISSTDNPFSISFSNTPLKLVDAGQPSEHYRFQVQLTKEVRPNVALTDDNAAAACFYNGTTFQAYLYTKTAKQYPAGGMQSQSSYTPWPYAVRTEQVIGGGQDVPNCYKVNNNVVGERITDGIDAKDGGSLCSCLYRNYLTPDPNA